MKPSKAIEAVVYEFGIRWPCPRDIDPDRYDMRLRDLMRLCAPMAPGLLRKAGDRIAVTVGRPFTLPSADELHGAADAIMADRAAAQIAAQRAADPTMPRHPQEATGRDERLMLTARQANRDNASKGSPNRWTDKMDQFVIGSYCERRATRNDGSVIEPWLGDDKEWHPPAGDSGLLASAYEQHGAHYAIRGGCIVDTRPMLDEAR